MPYPLRFRLPSFKDASQLRGFLELYPDVFEFQFNEISYRRAWENLRVSPRRYLMVSNGQLETVSILRFGYERFKGWLGLGNACHPSKVNMMAQKLAYFGYLNGFNQENMVEVLGTWPESYRPTEVFLNTTKEARSNHHSHYLQQEMVAYYKAHAADLNAPMAEKSSIIKPHVDEDFVFGATYAQSGDIDAMAAIDVQNEHIIYDYIRELPHGQLTLPYSTFRRVYVTHIFDKIKLLLDEATLNEVYKGSVLGVLGQLFSSESKSFEDVVRELDFEVNTTVELWPEIAKNHISMLVKLKVILAEQQSGQAIAAKDGLYKAAYQLIREHSEGLQSFGLMQYFLEDAGFRVLDPNEALVQSWGEHLFEVVRCKAFPKEKQALYLYRVAQLRPDLLPADDLPIYIDATLHQQNFPLARVLIETLSLKNMGLARDYLTQHAKNLVPLLKKDTPLSIAYAKQLVVGAESLWTPMSFFGSKDDAYRQAEALASTIPTREGASFFFEKYVTVKAWDQASALLTTRKEAGLTLENLPKSALKALADHYVAEATRLTNEGKVFLVVNDVEAAETSYRQGLTLLKLALGLIDNDAYRFALNVQRRMLAELIFEHSKTLGNLKLARLDEARRELMDVEKTVCSKKDESFTKTYIEILDSMVQGLHEGCLIATEHRTVIASASHRVKSLVDAKQLIELIDKLMLLRGSEKALSLHRKQLAALYFLKAEVLAYFELEGDVIMNYRKARDLDPNQPFYQLRYVEVLANTDTKEVDVERAKGIQLLHARGLDGFSYVHWADERWQPEQDRIYKVSMPEVDSLALPSSSFLAKFRF